MICKNDHFTVLLSDFLFPARPSIQVGGQAGLIDILDFKLE